MERTGFEVKLKRNDLAFIDSSQRFSYTIVLLLCLFYKQNSSLSNS